MGAFGEAFGAYAQPLLDQTDGSYEQVDKAMKVAQFCWNLATLPEESRDAFLANLRSAMPMDDEEFEDFRQSILEPMVRRHHQMFPGLGQNGPGRPGPRWSVTPELPSEPEPTGQSSERVGRNDPCPCGSGRKYKKCCG